MNPDAERRAKKRFFARQLKAAERDEKNADAALLEWPDDKRIELDAHRCRVRRLELELALEKLEAAA